MTLNKSDDIIIGIPVDNPINCFDSIDLSDSTNSDTCNNIGICRKCKFQFIRKEIDNGTMQYFYCEECRKNQFIRTCCNSCCIC